MLVPPENYSMVEDGIYRCSKLDAINISFLKSLELRSIVWINEEKPPRVLRQFIEEHQIRLFHMMNSSVLPEEDEITNLKYQEWMVLKPSLISKSIEIILDVTNQNCLLMDKSEVIVGILRHIQRWNYSSISNEYRLYASRASYKVEIFLELINIELLSHVADTIEVNTSALPSLVDDLDESTNELASEHSSSKAISIKPPSPPQNSTTAALMSPSKSTTTTYPAIRRLSIEHSGGTATPSPPLSSSVGRLSISTSPQIPKNLLKIVEMRKNKKKYIMELKEKEEKESREHLQGAASGAAGAAGAAAEDRPSPLRTLSSTAVEGGARPRPPPSPLLPTNGPVGAIAHAAEAARNPAAKSPRPPSSPALPAPPTSPAAPPAGPAPWTLYRPRTDGARVRRQTHGGPHGPHGSHARAVPTAIRVQLPPEACLPAWFRELRALCERAALT